MGILKNKVGLRYFIGSTEKKGGKKKLKKKYRNAPKFFLYFAFYLPLTLY
jgi:hypothetical protein